MRNAGHGKGAVRSWTGILRAGFAFAKKDFIEDTSYRLAFAIDFAGALVEITLFYFIASLIGRRGGEDPVLGSYGYFPFILVGIAFIRFTNGSMRSFAHKIQDYQVTGTLEAMLSTPTSIFRILFSSVLWQHLYLTFVTVVYFLIGLVVFGVTLERANWLSVACVLVLTVSAFSCLGILAASFIMFYKRGDPVLWLFGIVSSLLGGVYFPTDVLPSWLKYLSDYVPITYTLGAMRGALLQGASLSDIMPQMAVLLVFSSILMPVSLISFRYSVWKARDAGILSHF